MPARWTTADIPDQTARTVLITGANAGIGCHTRGVPEVSSCGSAEV